MTSRRNPQTTLVPKAEYIYGALPLRVRREETPPKRKKQLVSWFRLERSRVSPGFGEAVSA
jgi:hypothetical protein